MRPHILIVAALLMSSAAQAEQTFTVNGKSFSVLIQPENSGGYDRDDWPHWNRKVDGGCFSVRDKVLADESLKPVRTVPASRGRCRVVEGLWKGPYTGKTFTHSSRVQIDHVVPLHEAHKSGGYAWTRAERKSFANDLKYAHHLIAVDGPENGARKSDKDPAGYLPKAEFRCRYIEYWLTIKQRWNISMDQAEASAIRKVLTGC